MLFEIFKFEIKYRAKRPETYLYFIILFLFSVVSVHFLADGKLSSLKVNSPYIIARTMGIVTALFMVLSSMIMGMAVLRDFNYKMESLIFVNPINKRDYFFGKFLGSFMVLVLTYLALPLGMIVGEFMPWNEPDILLTFNILYYTKPFIFLVLPTLFFGGAIFFVSGALSRKLIVVYTQGFFFLLVYLLAISMAIGSDDLFYTALIEPFTFQSVRIATKMWSVADRMTLPIPMNGVLLYNRLLWTSIGVIALAAGYFAFNFRVIRDKYKGRTRDLVVNEEPETNLSDPGPIPLVDIQTNLFSGLEQVLHHAFYSFKLIVREVPFWTIVLCGMGILCLNSFNLGTIFGVDSFPTTDRLIGELFELTIIFFLAIILFYSGELIWQERDTKFEGIYDALPYPDFVRLGGKFLGLQLILAVMISSLILAGILFQASKGYFEFDLHIYFIGFFIEIYPFLLLLSVLCFFFQILVNHKFLSHLIVLIFVLLSTVPFQILGYDHGLYVFGGSGLGTYSAMNGYGHFVEPYLWFKVYWLSFGFILLAVGNVLMVRGKESKLIVRLNLAKSRWTTPMKRFSGLFLLIFLLSGAYLFFNTNVLNQYRSQSTENELRADYERILKPYQDLPQPQIVNVQLELELFPKKRNYEVEGVFSLVNKFDSTINEIHIQKAPNDQILISDLWFDRPASPDDTYGSFGYLIYHLKNPLMPGDSLKLHFSQSYTSVGFTENADTDVVYNGTFIDNNHLPTLGYLDEIELKDDQDRADFRLSPKKGRAAIDDPMALKRGKSGGDGEEINFELIIGTDLDQTAIAPGHLINRWKDQSRSYFHYKMNKPMSNFYAILSATYKLESEQVWLNDSLSDPVNLEIYYHDGHEYNLDRMMNGMIGSLQYCSENFGEYPYQDLRIAETTIYKNRAQSFPGLITFSEGTGFMLNINDEVDVDMAYFIAAHETAHQWWGHMINPADVQGKSMISESLAQYSALMTLQNHFPKSRVEQLLETQQKDYQKGRSRETGEEKPLALVDSGQEYIYYNKGMINLYTFQSLVSEDSVNVALMRFVRDWNSFDGRLKMASERYPTTADLLGYFNEVTPDTLRYKVHELFEMVSQDREQNIF